MLLDAFTVRVPFFFFFAEFADFILVDNIQHREFVILFGVLRYITVIIIIIIIMFPSA